MRAAVPFAEGWELGHGWKPLPDLLADPSTARPGHVDPGVSIPLLAGKCGGVDAPGIGILAGQRWNLHALPGFRLEDPAMYLQGARPPSNHPQESGMPRWGQTSGIAKEPPVFFRPKHKRDPRS